MKDFIRKYDDRIHGVLSCFDRMLFRGYLPIMSGWAMAQFLDGFDVNGSSLKPFLLQNSEGVKNNALAMAQKHERPFQYLASPIRKEDTARQLAERDGIEEGLVCIFSVLEPCRTFSLRPRRAKQGPSLALAFHRAQDRFAGSETERKPRKGESQGRDEQPGVHEDSEHRRNARSRAQQIFSQALTRGNDTRHTPRHAGGVTRLGRFLRSSAAGSHRGPYLAVPRAYCRGRGVSRLVRCATRARSRRDR